MLYQYLHKKKIIPIERKHFLWLHLKSCFVKRLKKSFCLRGSRECFSMITFDGRCPSTLHLKISWNYLWEHTPRSTLLFTLLLSGFCHLRCFLRRLASKSQTSPNLMMKEKNLQWSPPFLWPTSLKIQHHSFMLCTCFLRRH